MELVCLCCCVLIVTNGYQLMLQLFTKAVRQQEQEILLGEFNIQHAVSLTRCFLAMLSETLPS